MAATTKISDLDASTRRLIFAALGMAKWPSNYRLQRLKGVAEQWDAEHEQERNSNLAAALFGPDRIMKVEN